jgi:hypothetical protein
MKDAKRPALFIPHGGGPWPFMSPPPRQPEIWAKLGIYLRSIPAMLVRSQGRSSSSRGHWQTSRPTVNVNPTLARFFDY